MVTKCDKHASKQIRTGVAAGLVIGFAVHPPCRLLEQLQARCKNEGAILSIFNIFNIEHKP